MILILLLFSVIGERPDDYENRLKSIDLEKIISLSELFMLESLPFHDMNEINSSEPLKYNFLMELQCLLDKLKWYDVKISNYNLSISFYLVIFFNIMF